MQESPLLELRSVTKAYGNVIGLQDVNLKLAAGQVLCILGDNGAGKSTLIKIISGVHRQTSGEIFFAGEKVTFKSPAQAKKMGISTVQQDLSIVPLLSVWRNFFLGNEITKGSGLLSRLDIPEMKQIASERIADLGVVLDDLEQPMGSLSGGQRQSLAIARGIAFGTKVLVLDEPTAALGVKQSELVLSLIKKVREQGIAVIFITHNPYHAYPVGDKFLILNRGRCVAEFNHDQTDITELTRMMSGEAQ